MVYTEVKEWMNVERFRACSFFIPGLQSALFSLFSSPGNSLSSLRETSIHLGFWPICYFSTFWPTPFPPLPPKPERHVDYACFSPNHTPPQKQRLHYPASIEERERRKHRRKAKIKNLKIVSHPKSFNFFFFNLVVSHEWVQGLCKIIGLFLVIITWNECMPAHISWI